MSGYGRSNEDYAHYQILSIVWAIVTILVLCTALVQGMNMSASQSESESKVIIACVSAGKEWVNDECRK